MKVKVYLRLLYNFSELYNNLAKDSQNSGKNFNYAQLINEETEIKNNFVVCPVPHSKQF